MAQEEAGYVAMKPDSTNVANGSSGWVATEFNYDVTVKVLMPTELRSAVVFHVPNQAYLLRAWGQNLLI